MPKTIFVNLPVADLKRSMAFYEAVGARNEPMFTDATGACMVFSDVIHVMLLSHDKFRQFTAKAIADAHATSQMLLALSCESRDGVDAVTEAALAAGGREPRDRQDHGFMYGRSFEDPDGHTWEPFFMDMEAAQAVHAKEPA